MTLEEAEQRGRDAFQRGESRVPVWDPKIRAFQREFPSIDDDGQCKARWAIYDAWIRGWDSAKAHYEYSGCKNDDDEKSA